jgi:hypothetical protein
VSLNEHVLFRALALGLPIREVRIRDSAGARFGEGIGPWDTLIGRSYT